MTSSLYPEHVKDNIRKNLKTAEETIAEIELTNDKSRRVEWRELKKFVKWAKSVVE